jgi:hypothetical protein
METLMTLPEPVSDAERRRPGVGVAAMGPGHERRATGEARGGHAGKTQDLASGAALACVLVSDAPARGWRSECYAGLANVSKALLRISFQATLDQSPIRRREVLRQQRPIHVLPQDSRERVARGLAVEESVPAEHLEHHHAERPDVGALVDGLASRLLRAHVVEDLDVALGCHANVRGLEVPVDDALLVSRLESFSDLPRDSERLVDRDRAALEALLKVFSLDEFKREGDRALVLRESMDGRDVRMVEGCEHLSLAAEAGHPLMILRERRRQDLDRDVAPEGSVASAVDLTHAPGADGNPDFVGSDA